MQGWIKIHRQLADNPMWLSEQFTRAQAWIDMLMLANHKEGFFYVRGNKIVVKRGQIGRSQDNLAERWKWSRGKVKRFLNELEKEGQVVQQKSRIKALITLKNYDKFQGDSTTDDTTDGRQTVQQTDANKNDNNNNNAKSTSDTPKIGDVKVAVGLKDFYKENEQSVFKELCIAIALKKKVSQDDASQQFKEFEAYFTSTACNKKIALKKDWKRSFQNWIETFLKSKGRLSKSQLHAKNTALAIHIHDAAVNNLSINDILDRDSEQIQSHAVFLNLINKGYTKEDIAAVLDDIEKIPPQNKIYSWGYLYQYFS